MNTDNCFQNGTHIDHFTLNDEYYLACKNSCFVFFGFGNLSKLTPIRLLCYNKAKQGLKDVGFLEIEILVKENKS